MPKKTSTEVKAMNDDQFLSYKHILEGEELEILEKNAAFDAEIHAFDISHSQSLSAADKTARNAIFTAYGRDAPVEGPHKT